MRAATPAHSPPDAIDCETAIRRLWDYLDGRLPALSHHEVEAHLASCALCSPHFEFADEMRKALATSSLPLSSDDEARLRHLVRGALERVAGNDANGAEAREPSRGD